MFLCLLSKPYSLLKRCGFFYLERFCIYYYTSDLCLVQIQYSTFWSEFFWLVALLIGREGLRLDIERIIGTAWYGNGTEWKMGRTLKSNLQDGWIGRMDRSMEKDIYRLDEREL